MAFSRMALTQKIPPGDDTWGEFNGSFSNMDLEAIEIANLIYQGHPFTTWHKDHWRHSRNYELGQHIGIDFDTEDKRSTLKALASDKFVERYGGMVYTTPSHKPEAPRARVLFLLDQPIYQAENYALSVSALLFLFGAADRQCKDPARFFYGSVDCEVEYLDNVLPIAVIKDVIGRYRNVQAALHKPRSTATYDAPVDQAKVKAALDKIPANGIDYDEWVRVLMGIHKEFGDAGLSLASSWADGSPGEVERKFKSFNDKGNGRGATTAATIFSFAQRFGWVGG